MSRLAFAASSAAAVLAWGMAAQAATCTTQIAGRTLDPDQIYPSAHACRPCPESRPASIVALCGAIDRIMMPNTTQNADLAIIPHRGLWGGSTGPDPSAASENTQAAFSAALTAGYRAVEVDIAKASDGIFVGHYFTMRSAGGNDTDPKDLTLAQIATYKMNKRDGGLSTVSAEGLPKLVDVILWAKANQVLVMLDPKTGPNSPAGEYNQIVAKALRVAYDNGALTNVVIKTTESYSDTKAAMDTEFGATLANQLLGKFLWSPIVNKDEAVTMAAATSAVDNWRLNTEAGKGVIMFEVGVMYPTHWSAGSIPIPGGGFYENLIHYAMSSSPYAKRAAIWSIDPMSDKGTLGRLYTYKFIGNSSTDRRGDVVQNLTYPWAMYAAVTTDRPDFYKSVASSPYW